MRNGEAQSWEDYEAAVRALETKVIELETAFADPNEDTMALEPEVRAGIKRASQLGMVIYKAKMKVKELGY